MFDTPIFSLQIRTVTKDFLTVPRIVHPVRTQ